MKELSYATDLLRQSAFESLLKIRLKCFDVWKRSYKYDGIVLRDEKTKSCMTELQSLLGENPKARVLLYGFSMMLSLDEDYVTRMIPVLLRLKSRLDGLRSETQVLTYAKELATNGKVTLPILNNRGGQISLNTDLRMYPYWNKGFLVPEVFVNAVKYGLELFETLEADGINTYVLGSVPVRSENENTTNSCAVLLKTVKF